MSASSSEYWNSLLLTKPPMRSAGWFCRYTLRPGMSSSCGRRPSSTCCASGRSACGVERHQDAAVVQRAVRSAGADEADRPRDVGCLRRWCGSPAAACATSRRTKCPAQPSVVATSSPVSSFEMKPLGTNDVERAGQTAADTSNASSAAERCASTQSSERAYARLARASNRRSSFIVRHATTAAAACCTAPASASATTRLKSESR